MEFDKSSAVGRPESGKPAQAEDAPSGAGTPVIGAAQVRAAMDTLRRYRNGKAALERRIVENEEFWRLRHWEHIPEQGTAPLKTRSAWLVNVLLSKHADAMDAFPEPSCLPRAQDDEEEAAALSAVIPVILSQNDFERTWSENWWKKLKAGVAFYGVFWDREACGGRGDVAVTRVDPLSLYWEPGVDDLQKSRNLFHVELADNESLTERWPQLRGRLQGSGFRTARYLCDENIDLSDKTPVIDWYYKKRVGGRTVLHYVKFVGEEVLFATENEAACRDGLYAHGLYPFFADVLFPEEGSPAGYGYVDLCKDAQRQIDLMNSAIVANCVAAATPRWLKRGDDGINEAEYADWTRPFVHVQGSIEENALRPIPVSQLSGIYLNVLSAKINEMKETSGNRDVNNGGAPSGVTAASAIAAMQEQSGKLSRDQIRVSYQTFKDVVSCVIEVIRQFYDAPRMFRITGEMGQEEFVSYDNSGLQMQGFTDPATGMTEFHQPVFDLKITAQKATEYSKMSQNELALQLYQLGMFAPNNADPALSTLEMMDFDGKDQVMQRVQQNGTLLQMLQMVQQENMALKAAMGIPVQGMEGGPAPAPAAPTGGSTKLPEASDQQGIAQPNRIADKAKARAQAATQPG